MAASRAGSTSASLGVGKEIQGKMGSSPRTRSKIMEELAVIGLSIPVIKILATGASQQHGRVGDDRAWHSSHNVFGDSRAFQQDGVYGGDRAKHWQQGEWGDQHLEGGSSGGAGRHQDLPELQGTDRSPLILGDWMEVIAPIMKDISPQAHRWWPLVEQDEKWRESTLVERLYVRPQCNVVEEDPSLQRTEQRGISLMIKAIPEVIKDTIISERLMTSTGILFTLMKNFQPGEQERERCC